MKKVNKLIIFIITLVLLFSLFIFFITKKYSYSKEYRVDKYKIEEEYIKDKETYKYRITNKDRVYVYLLKNEYIRKKELIDSIEEYINEDEVCIIPKSNYMSFYPECNNKEDTYYSSIEDVYKYKYFKEINKKYKKYNISSLNNHNYFLYNYKGFDIISKKDNKSINIFRNDVYNIDLYTIYNQFLIIPDYTESHFFNKLYVINMENYKVKEIEFNYDISFESNFYILKNKLFIYDNKNEKYYSVNVKKLRIEELKKVNISLEENNVNKYEVINNNLYYIVDKDKILISKDVKELVSNIEDEVYYIKDSSLYLFNPINGENKLIDNFEWNFRSKNMVFIK